MVGRELARAVQAVAFAAVLLEQRDVLQHRLGVAADPAEDVGAGEGRQVVVAGEQAHPEGDAVEVGSLQRPERHLVVPHQRGDVLAPGDRASHLPQHPAHQQIPGA